MLKSEPDFKDEFCYMLKKDNAYDWQCVDFRAKDEAVRNGRRLGKMIHDEYMTISARGIVHSIDGEETFITLDDWQKEYEIYNKLKKIKFFNHYKLWKNFMLWRKLRRRTNFKTKKSFLEKYLFLIDEKLRQPLLDIRSICHDISNRASLIELGLTQPKLMVPFEQGLNENQLREAEWLNQMVNGTIKKKLADSCQVSLNHFKEMNDIKIREGDTAAKPTDKPIVIANDSGKEKPYTQQSTINLHYKKLKKFIRLIDYLVLDSKMNMVNNSLVKAGKFLESAEQILAQKLRNNGGLIPILVIKPEFVNEQIVFNPSLERILKSFDDTISRGLHYVCDQHAMLLNAPEFVTYTSVNENGKETGNETLDLHQIVLNHETFSFYRGFIMNLFTKIFDYVIKNTDDLEKILQIVVKCRNFRPQMLEGQERQYIQDLLVALVQDDDLLKRINEKLEVGIFSYEREDLKAEIIDVAQQCMQLIEDNLPDIITRRCSQYIAEMTAIHTKLSEPILEVEQFIRHMREFEECQQEFELKQGEYSILQDLSLLFNSDQFRIHCPDECKTALLQSKSTKDTVKKIIDEINEKLDAETQRFKKELTELVPKLDRERIEISEYLDKLDVNNPERDATDLVDTLKPEKDKMDELVATAEKYQKFQLTLNMDVTSIEDIVEFRRKVTNYYNFWTMRQEWETLLTQWLEQPVCKLNHNDLRTKVELNFKKTNMLIKEIENAEAFKAYKDELEKYKGVALILESFAIDALKDAPKDSEEWKEIKGMLSSDPAVNYQDFEFKSDDFTLYTVLSMNMIKYKNEIYEVAMRAAKEKELKARLEKIKAFTGSISFNMEPYKGDKSIMVLGNNDDLIKKLDSSLVDITNILSNKYVVRIKKEVDIERRKLGVFQEVIDEICFCQRMWMYLEPIFNSDENNKELAKERKIFKTAVHTPFTKITKELGENPKTFMNKMIRAGDKLKTDQVGPDGKPLNSQPDLRSKNELPVIHAELESLEKKLINYLERKRKSFPRFYFISNDDLIEILSQAKDFDKVQGHMNKLFDAVKKIYIGNFGLLSGLQSRKFPSESS